MTLKVNITPCIRSLLQEVATDDHLSQALRSTAAAWTESETLPWGVLRDMCASVRAARSGNPSSRSSSSSSSPPATGAGAGGGPWAHELCRGGGLALPGPPARARTITAELEAHLERLRRKLEQDSYDRMVQDVTQSEREAREKAERGFRSYKQQISFGLHVVVMMGAFYAFGHALGLAVAPAGSKLYPLAIGLACMVGALILETVLFVIRTTVPYKLEPEQRQQEHLQAGSGGGAGQPAAQRQQQEEGPLASRQQGRQSVREAGAVGGGSSMSPAVGEDDRGGRCKGGRGAQQGQPSKSSADKKDD